MKIRRDLTRRGARFIGGFEGFVSCPYRDPVGIWTIGFGTTENVGQRTPCITRTKALRLLRRDAREVSDWINDHVDVGLNRNEHDALVSLGYNIGIGGLAESTVVRELNAGRRQNAGDAFLLWNKATIGGQLVPLLGLTRRRHAERSLFLRRPRYRTRLPIGEPKAVQRADANCSQ